MSKVLERLLRNHLEEHLDLKMTLQDEQFGFRKRHATTHQVMRIVEDAHNGFAVGAKTALLFLDVDKAFDRLWTNGLLAKCIMSGMPTWLMLMIRDFLNDRTYRVKVNHCLSTDRGIQAGVPQGSVLGPMLFNLYMSDLQVPNPGKLALYADDAAIYVQSIHNTRITGKLQQIIPSIESWYHTWRMTINPKKTKCLFVARERKAPPKKKVKIHGQEIQWSKSHVYLGVTLDPTLNFKKHVEEKMKNAKAVKGRLLPLIGNKSKISLFNRTLIFSQLFLASILYACPVWAEAAFNKIQKISTFQRNFFKHAMGLPRFVNGEQIERQFRIKTVHERILEIFNNYLERIDDHPNALIRESVCYDLKAHRKRKRPRDYLLRKPP